MACTESGLCDETAIRHTPPDCSPLPTPRCSRPAQSKGEDPGEIESKRWTQGALAPIWRCARAGEKEAWRGTQGALARDLNLPGADTKVHDRSFQEARRGIPGLPRPLLASGL